jgi:hypothetical protein
MGHPASYSGTLVSMTLVYVLCTICEEEKVVFEFEFDSRMKKFTRQYWEQNHRCEARRIIRLLPSQSLWTRFKIFLKLEDK